MQTFWLRAEHGLMPIAGKDNDDIHESASVQYCCCQGSLFVAFERDALPAAPTVKGNAWGFATVCLNFASSISWQSRLSDWGWGINHNVAICWHGRWVLSPCLNHQKQVSSSPLSATPRRLLRAGAEGKLVQSPQGFWCWEEPLRRHPPAPSFLTL